MFERDASGCSDLDRLAQQYVDLTDHSQKIGELVSEGALDVKEKAGSAAWVLWSLADRASLVRKAHTFWTQQRQSDLTYEATVSLDNHLANGLLGPVQITARMPSKARPTRWELNDELMLTFLLNGRLRWLNYGTMNTQDLTDRLNFWRENGAKAGQEAASWPPKLGKDVDTDRESNLNRGGTQGAVINPAGLLLLCKG